MDFAAPDAMIEELLIRVVDYFIWIENKCYMWYSTYSTKDSAPINQIKNEPEIEMAAV